MLKLLQEKLISPATGNYVIGKNGLEFVNPDADVTSGELTRPITFQTPQPQKPAPFFQMDKDTGKLRRVDVQGLQDKQHVLDYNPPQPASGREKETPQEKIDRDTYQQYLKAISGMADFTETLQKQMEATAPRLGLEKALTRGPEDKTWYGKKTGKRLPGVTYYKPKGTMTEDELDILAEDELQAAFEAKGLKEEEIKKYMTPGNIEAAKKQIRARKKK